MRHALDAAAATHEKTEATLRASEQRFRGYFEMGLIGMAITSPTKGCLEANPQICDILGYTRDELLGMHWPRITHPDDRAADKREFLRAMAGEIDGYTMDKRWIRKDGAIVHSTISVKCTRHADGSVDYFMGLLQDITERKRIKDALRESLALYQHTLDHMLEGCQIIDFDWRYLYINAASAQQNRQAVEALIGRTMMEVYPGLEQTPSFALLRLGMVERIAAPQRDGVHLP